MSNTAKEIGELSTRLQQVNNNSDDQEIFELVTRTEALLQRDTDEQNPYLRNARLAIERYFAKNGSAANCQVTLRKALLGVVEAFKSNFESGFIVETGLRKRSLTD